MELWQKIRILNANGLKILAAALMLVDHIGLLFFPNELAWRIIGRLSMPLFALALSEGCRYTKNKALHFGLIAALALVCQIVYYFVDHGNLYMCILVTFSFSILTIYAMQFMKKALFSKTADAMEKGLSVVLFVTVVMLDYAFCQIFTVDYGFWGIMTPVFASLFDFRDIPAPKFLKELDTLVLRVFCLELALLMLAQSQLPETFAFYALGSVPFLLMYNGEKGKWNIKYFFYVFYPLHLVVLQVLAWLI